MTSPAEFNPPELSRVLARRRLFRMLDEGRKGPVTWVVGPPGSGKTTVVASHVAARRIGTVWYRLDADDGDPVTGTL